MTEQERNKALMRKVARAFVHGDMAPLKAALADDVVWTSRSPKAFFRHAGDHHGQVGVTEHSALTFAAYNFNRFEPKEIVADGNSVWGLFDTELLHRVTGRVAKLEIAVRWVMKDGKIASHENFFDTASLLIQQGEIAPPSSPNANAA